MSLQVSESNSSIGSSTPINSFLSQPYREYETTDDA